MQYCLPAIGTFYFAFSAIWGLPYGEEVVGTITALESALGIFLGVSSAKYHSETKEESDG
jgi:hypothetical protein